jgi:DNA-binding transcriptional LysR family regulator
MNITYRQLKAFMLVARLGNFTRAAEQLHITQAGLSVMIRELEAQLDNRLFDRTTRTVTLTAAGEKFLPAAKTAVNELEAAAAELTDIGERSRRNLRVAATPLVSSNLLPAVCALFRKRHPEIHVQLIDNDLQRVHALVENGEVDFGVGFFFKAARGVERSLLCSFQLMRVSSLDSGAPDHASNSKSRRLPAVGKVPWSTMANDVLIGLPLDNPIQQLVEKNLSKIGRGNEERQVFNHFDTLIAMVAAGMGNTIIPTFAMQACRRHRVRTELLTEPEVTLGFYRITKRGRAQSALAVEFSDTLVALLPGLESGC